MKRKMILVAGFLLSVTLTSLAQGQVGVYSGPVTTYYAPPRAAVVAPIAVAPRAAVYYAPAPVMNYAPVAVAPRTTTYYSSVSSMPLATVPVRGSVVAAPAAAYPNAYVEPVTVMRPVVSYSPVVSASPVIAASPVVAGPVMVGRPVVAGRGIVGQPKLYVTGQPLLNSVRFLTP